MTLLKKIAVSFVAAISLLSAGVYADNHPKLSVQLWSVKEDVAKDFEGTLKKLAAMGFQGVEFAGNFGPYADNPEGLKKFLKDNGLEVSGAHVGFAGLNDENFDKTVAFFKTLGAKYLVVPMDQRAFSPDGIDAVVAELTANAAKLKAHGLYTGYHNHAPEFADFKGTTYWDYLATNTPKDVILQLDIAWAAMAGKDPAEYVRKYPGRTITTHFKAAVPTETAGKRVIIGEDLVDWKNLINATREVGGTQWYVVEQEIYPDNLAPMEAIELSLNGLKKILAEMNAK
jgi:sugar phosphate isomerase/epimerase